MNACTDEATGEFEIGSVQFGILSAEEIVKMAVVHVTNPRITSAKSADVGSVYDARMGTCALAPAQKLKKCATCALPLKDCHGHFGYISLNVPVANPLCLKHILNFLKLFCFSCYRLILGTGQVELYGLLHHEGSQRYLRVLKKIKSCDACSHCGRRQPKYSLVVHEQTIYAASPTVSAGGAAAGAVISLSSDSIFRILDNVSDADVRLIGISPENAHPRNLILRVLPILPTMARPFAVSGGKTLSDDDLTVQYVEIIKINNQLLPDAAVSDAAATDQRVVKLVQLLHIRIQTLFRNGGARSKHGSANGHVTRGFVDRIAGKQGQIRNNIMGKRVDKTGRSVIGAEPTLGMLDFGVPECVARTLTFPEVATPANLAWLQRLVDTGETNFVKKKSTGVHLTRKMMTPATTLFYGDNILSIPKNNQTMNDCFLGAREGCIPCGPRAPALELAARAARLSVGVISHADHAGLFFVVDPHRAEVTDGDRVFRAGTGELSAVEPARRRRLDVHVGDVVERHLRDDDVIVVNRQPTLHRGSIMGRRVRVMPGKTFRMDLATTGSFNADFDGDEFNIHVPQDQESRAEVLELCMSSSCVMSAATSATNINIVQDSMLVTYLMSRFDERVEKCDFFDAALAVRGMTPAKALARIASIEAVLAAAGRTGPAASAFTARGLLALVFPPNFSFDRNTDDGPVTIRRGVILAGALTKPILNHQIVACVHENYSLREAVDFIDNVQFVVTKWFENRSFSVGLEDCVMTGDRGAVGDAVKRYLFEADQTRRSAPTARAGERRVCEILSGALNVGLRISRDNMSPKNNFLHTVKSGSKGALFNLTQITGILGQQIVLGGRMKKTLNHGARTLAHYPFVFADDAFEDDIRSQGFIDTGFGRGLDPRQLFIHTVTGREAVTDSALETANSGYAQRRLVKIFEDVLVAEDGTVRDQNNCILSLVYGDHGFDPLVSRNVRTRSGETVQRFCDAAFLLNIANGQVVAARCAARQQENTCQQKKRGDENETGKNAKNAPAGPVAHAVFSGAEHSSPPSPPHFTGPRETESRFRMNKRRREKDETSEKDCGKVTRLALRFAVGGGGFHPTLSDTVTERTSKYY